MGLAKINVGGTWKDARASGQSSFSTSCKCTGGCRGACTLACTGTEKTSSPIPGAKTSEGLYKTNYTRPTLKVCGGGTWRFSRSIMLNVGGTWKTIDAYTESNGKFQGVGYET